MNDLNSRARAVIEAARDADEPSLADRDRIKRAVLVQVATGVAASTVAAGTVSAGAGMGLGMSIGMKVGLAVLAVSLVGGGTAGYLHRTRQHSLASVSKYDVGKVSATPISSALTVERPAVAAPPSVAPTQTEGKARKQDRARKPAGQGNQVDHFDQVNQVNSGGGRVAQEDQLNAEVAVLKRAREELRLGRPTQALEALLEYDRRFGKGALGEERQAIAAIAGCQAHPGPSARAQAQAFMRSSPKSPLLDRVRAACITPTRAGSL